MASGQDERGMAYERGQVEGDEALGLDDEEP